MPEKTEGKNPAQLKMKTGGRLPGSVNDAGLKDPNRLCIRGKSRCDIQ
jgi:hypothetical protein